jgi:hypothetical protein
MLLPVYPVSKEYGSGGVVRSIYQIGDPDLAADFVARLAPDLGDDFCLLETHRTG